MVTTTYMCVHCNKTHTHRFARPYRPHLRWLETCPHCKRYGMNRLVLLVNPDQSKCGPCFRSKQEVS